MSPLFYCFYSYLEETFFGGEIRDLCVPIDSNNILPTPGIFFLLSTIFLIKILL